MDSGDPFPSKLAGWRRDVLDVARPLVDSAGVVLLMSVLLVAIFGAGSPGAARGGANCLAALLLFGPPIVPMTYWSDRTAIREGDQLYVETFLAGRRVLAVAEVRRVATRMLAGRGGTTYYAAI